MPLDYCIWIVSPPGYPHSRCFEEVALSLKAAFAELGYDTPVVSDPALIRGHAIVLGANLLDKIPEPLPQNLVLYNLEQAQKNSVWLKDAYVNVLRRYPVWDYSALNCEKLREYYGIEAVLCGIGYMPVLERIATTPENIDVLFIGSMNERRMNVLNAMAKRGANVYAAYNSYGPERDALIARAKIVINIHFYEAQVFEIVRVSYLLANHKCVVSESGLDYALEAPLKDGVAFAPYEHLTDSCLRLLGNENARTALSRKGYECFRRLSQVPMLESALACLTKR